LALAKPVFASRGVTTTRAVIILAIHTDSGAVGIGEAAPLPDHGTETFESCWYAARRICGYQDYPPLAEELPPLMKWPQSVDIQYSAHPALHFALQSALLTILAVTQDKQAAAFFGEPPRPAISVNALLPGSTADTILDAAGCAVDNGFRTLKIKVGRRPLGEDLELIKQMSFTFPDVRLRLDANNAWDGEDAAHFCGTVEGSNIEYIEDPLQATNLFTLSTLRKVSRLPIALDDAARRPDVIEPLIEERLFDVLVLKPTVLGSFDLVSDLSAKARRKNIDVVITSTLESSIGLSYVCAFAATLGSAQRAHGVGTGLLLEEDTLRQTLRPSHGTLFFPDLNNLSAKLTDDLARELLIGNAA